MAPFFGKAAVQAQVGFGLPTALHGEMVDRARTDPVRLEASCLIPRFDGVILSKEWKEALWDKFVTGAPRPRTPSELQYSDRKLRSRS
jgi:hypothetical protein